MFLFEISFPHSLASYIYFNKFRKERGGRRGEGREGESEKGREGEGGKDEDCGIPLPSKKKPN